MTPLHTSSTETRGGAPPDRTSDNRTLESPTGDRITTNTSRSTPRTRRAFLTLFGTTSAIGFAGCLDDGTETEYGWNEVDSPVEKTLYDVVMSVDGPYAVGEDGRVIARRSDSWEIVVEDGPGGAANRLSTAAVTDDGRHVWFAGSSGAIGKRDVSGGEGTDHSAPKQKTSSWEDIAVVGASGRERIHLINGSGELLSGANRGGEIEWGNVVKPAGGVDPTAIGFTNGAGFVSDTNGSVYRTTDEKEWERIGIPDEDGTINDVAPLDSRTADVVTGTGTIFTYNGSNWIQLDASQHGLRTIDREADRGFAVGTSGTIYELDDADWSEQSTSTSRTLYGTALGTTDYAGVAVGANGTILERFR